MRLLEKVVNIHQKLSMHDEKMSEAYSKGLVEGFSKAFLNQIIIINSYTFPKCFGLLTNETKRSWQPRCQKSFRQTFQDARGLCSPQSPPKFGLMLVGAVPGR